MCFCEVESIDIQQKEISDFASNVGLNLLSARSDLDLFCSDYCYICYEDCYVDTTFIFRIHEICVGHKNENICISCMNKYLRNCFELEKNNTFFRLFDEIDDARNLNPYLSDVLNCPFQSCRKSLSLEDIKRYYEKEKKDPKFVRN